MGRANKTQVGTVEQSPWRESQEQEQEQEQVDGEGMENLGEKNHKGEQ